MEESCGKEGELGTGNIRRESRTRVVTLSDGQHTPLFCTLVSRLDSWLHCPLLRLCPSWLLGPSPFGVSPSIATAGRTPSSSRPLLDRKQDDPTCHRLAHPLLAQSAADRPHSDFWSVSGLSDLPSIFSRPFRGTVAAASPRLEPLGCAQPPWRRRIPQSTTMLSSESLRTLAKTRSTRRTKNLVKALARYTRNTSG